jgi:dolichol-phosphate mannosyltransferase
MFITSSLALLGFTLDWLINGVPFAGFGTIVATALLLLGSLFLFMGILSLYIGSIYEEVKARPNFIVRQTIGDPGQIDNH